MKTKFALDPATGRFTGFTIPHAGRGFVQQGGRFVMPGDLPPEVQTEVRRQQILAAELAKKQHQQPAPNGSKRKKP